MATRAGGLGRAGVGWGTEMGSDDDGRMMMGRMMTKQLFAIVRGRQLEQQARALCLSVSLSFGEHRLWLWCRLGTSVGTQSGNAGGVQLL